MSDISSVSGETDSQLDNMFPQDEEEDVEGQDKPINSIANNFRNNQMQIENSKEESDLDFDSEDDDNYADDADSDIFDDELKDSKLKQLSNGNKAEYKQSNNRKVDYDSALNDSNSVSQSGIQLKTQNSCKKKPKNLSKTKEYNSYGNKQNKQNKHHSNQDDQEEYDSEEHQQDEDDALEEEEESQGEDNEKENQDDFYNESFLQSSDNLDNRENLDKSSDDLDLSFSNQTSRQATSQQQSIANVAIGKRKNSLKLNQFTMLGSPRASRKNSDILQKENSMIQVSKPSDKLKKQYRKYQELASLIPTLRYFEWYETTAFQNKLLPIKFLTAASFWFMVCAEYFPRKMAYQKEEDIIKDLRNRIDKMYMEIINRTGKQQNQKSNSSNNLNQFQSASNLQNDDKSEDSIIQENEDLKTQNESGGANNHQEENTNKEFEINQNEDSKPQYQENKESNSREKQNKLNLDISVEGENCSNHQEYDQNNDFQKEQIQKDQQVNTKVLDKNNIEKQYQTEYIDEQLQYTQSNSSSFKKAQTQYYSKLSQLISDKEPSASSKDRSKDSNTKLGDDQESSQITCSEQNGILYKINEDSTQQINIEKEAKNETLKEAFEEAVTEKIQEQLNNLEQFINDFQQNNFISQSQILEESHKENQISHSNNQNQQKAEIKNQDENENLKNEQKNSLKNQLNSLDKQINFIIDQNQTKEINQVKLNYINKHAYTFEDEVYIIQNRLFLLETLNYFQIMEESSNEEKLIQLKNIELEKIINLLIIRYQQQYEQNNKEFENLKLRIKEDFEQERRINDVQSLDFNDILIDLNTMNPIEKEYIKFLESKQQLDYSQSIQIMQQQQNILGDLPDQAIVGQQSLKSQGSTKQVLIKHSEETRCQVCNECDYADNDLIVFCSRCNMSVHQKCYGIASLPQEDWICDACISFGPNAKYLRCALCTKRGGALKRSKMPVKTNFFEHLNTDYHSYLKNLPEEFSDQPEVYDTSLWENDKKRSTNKSPQNDENQEETELYFDFQYQNKVYPPEEIQKYEPKSKNIWIHLTCALWIQECYFEERSSLNMIRGIENIDKKRFLLTCLICKQKKSGCCIQCAKGKCSASFHPECARRAGLSLEVRHLEKVTHLVFCQRHTPLKLRRILEQKEKKYKDEIQKFCRSIEKYNETYFNEYKAKEKQKAFKPSKTLLKKALKDQEREEKEFMKQFSLYLLETPQNNFVINLSKEYDDFEESIIAYHVVDINRPKQQHLRTQISKNDDIWKTIEFNEYPPIHLFKLYKKLIKSKKVEFKNIFNSLKRIKDKEQEELFIKQQKQMKKEQQMLKKEMLRQEKEKKKMLQKQKQLEGLNPRKILHTENDNIESSQINQTNELSFLDDETSKMQLSQSIQQIQRAIQPKRKYNKQKKNNILENNASSNENGYSYIQNESNVNQSQNGDLRFNQQSHLNADTSNYNQEIENSNAFPDIVSASSDFPLKSKSKDKKSQKIKEKQNEKHIKNYKNIDSQQSLDKQKNLKKKLNKHRSKGEYQLNSQGEEQFVLNKSAKSVQGEDDDEKLYCYCQKPYNEGEFMIQCQNCEEWFHFECIGYIGTDTEAEDIDFFCNECDVDGKLFQSKEEYERFFDPQQALYSTYKQLKNKITTPSFRQKLILERKDLASANSIHSSTNLKSEKKKDKKTTSGLQENESNSLSKSKASNTANSSQDLANKKLQSNEQALLSQLIQISENQMKKQQEKSNGVMEVELVNQQIPKNNHNDQDKELYEELQESFSDIMNSSQEENNRIEKTISIEKEDNEEESLELLYEEFTDSYIKQNNIILEEVSTIIKLRKLEDGSIILVEDQNIQPQE
ncbi:PHD zinc finger protein (macronuclear) [Tetrahymena thermophila SB210]|uniref:PHD zinc finger protein n=1 Tax=Tetrahymena thermophila (strain SB210) TaxID=312017 RepID=I7MLU5_TETTS|nr:PHD zinc finger protein [Tetrahymena thermophila SB210]EAS03088.2 PHD zinc finger protein [Tetrahymena thermophila SB210]|eukprot:XP_001023333.2 PHD zinc finger protein [Tetrahymena thermophila SB210]